MCPCCLHLRQACRKQQVLAAFSLFSRNPRYIHPADFCKMTIDPSVADWAHSRKDSCGPRV
ncbi:hypothetical protein L208DRAFT_654206 [Tricholoma matsutake]|nr:hypothetical protein L208DRAFT_654206 [Tricholoma matsutake 945]